MNYFFVFQNKSFEIEHKGGFLWAPKSEDNGRRVSHWESMKEIKEGDLIIHSYNKKLVAVSIAKEDCKEAVQPEELKREQLWQDNGYIVHTEYIYLNQSIITSEHRDNILKLQPSFNAPFNRLGRGNPGYLFKSNKQLSKYLLIEILKVQNNSNIISILNEILSKVSGDHLDYGYDLKGEVSNTAVREAENNYLDKKEIEKKIEAIEEIKSLADTEKLTLIKSRVGHSILKMNLLEKEDKCIVCGLNDKRFLIASHIKPWRESDAEERLDINNVLLLCPHHDAVFDKGYISFEEDGTLLISNEISLESRALLNLPSGKKIDFNDAKRDYIRWHRENLFKE